MTPEPPCPPAPTAASKTSGKIIMPRASLRAALKRYVESFCRDLNSSTVAADWAINACPLTSAGAPLTQPAPCMTVARSSIRRKAWRISDYEPPWAEPCEGRTRRHCCRPCASGNHQGAAGASLLILDASLCFHAAAERMLDQRHLR